MNKTAFVYGEVKNTDCTVRENEPMNRHISFKLGGRAEVFIEPHSLKSLKEILGICRDTGVIPNIIGNGSNVLVSDDGVKGIVIKIGDKLGEIRLENDNEIVCEAGAPLSKLCRFALKHELTGLEFAWGIPGSVGGAIFMNAGAYNGEIKQVLIGTEHLTLDGKAGAFTADELDLSYRHSVYQDFSAVITSGRFRLQAGKKELIKSVMDGLMQRRQEKQPLEHPNAGSVFKRPEGQFAGALIEKCGLMGLLVGGAEVSRKHAGFIVNKGNATCAQVLELIDIIKTTVKKEFGIDLECEIRILK